MKRKWLIFRLYIMTICGKAFKNVNIIRKSQLFKHYGDGGYWHSYWIPSHPNLISIGNNVSVAADVRFSEHDLIHRMFNLDKRYIGPNLNYYTGQITVGDNVVIGARSIILYNVTVGDNALIAAGSVVTKDVPPFSVVAGSPARVVGSTKDLLKKRLRYSGFDITDYQYEKFYKNVE